MDQLQGGPTGLDQEMQFTYGKVQCDTSHCSLGSVDMKTKVLLQYKEHVQGALAGHQLCFVELKLLIRVSNSGGFKTCKNI